MKTPLALALAFAATVATGAAAEMALTSPDLTLGGQIEPSQYWNSLGCSGENARPALAWDGAPEVTKSFAVMFYDQDAPTGSGFWHWVVVNIPADVTGLPGDSLPGLRLSGIPIWECPVSSVPARRWDASILIPIPFTRLPPTRWRHPKVPPQR